MAAKIIGLNRLKDLTAFDYYRSQVGATVAKYKGTLVARGMVALILAAGPVCAEQHGVLPKDMPVSYRTECASCHVAIPPDMLTVGPWNEIMDSLGDHYGVDASLSDATTQTEIREFLGRYAGRPSSMRAMNHGDRLRMSDTLYFHRRHGKVKAYFADSRVMGPINCPVCHVGHEEGHYDAKSLTPLAKQFIQTMP